MGVGRRDFLSGLSATGALALAGCVSSGDTPQWRLGEFRVTFFNTGVGESIFMVFPDGTSALLDCGDPSILPELLRMNPHGDRVDYLILSHFHTDHADGFPKVAETLHFSHAIDRGWPDYVQPSKMPISQPWVRDYMKALYAKLGKRDGLTVEQVRLGSSDQVVPVHDVAACDDFSVRTIFANGKLVRKDGSIWDIFGPQSWRCTDQPENLMSIGFIITWGKFKLFTGGDFCDIFCEKHDYVCYDDMLAEIVEPVDVAKVNHHGCDALSRKLVAALRPKLWTVCAWHPSHMSFKTMSLLKDPTQVSRPGVVATDAYGEKHVLTIVVPEGGNCFKTVISHP